MFEYRREILAVYRARNFTRAAAELFVSQPALSATIKKAERALGFDLFDRAARPLRLTAEGQVYVASLLEVERLERSTEESVMRMRGLETGSVVAGGSTVFASLYLPSAIQAFAAEHPGVDVQLREGSTDQLFGLLESGQIDLMLDNCLAPSDQFCSVEVASERLCLAVRADCAPEWVREVAVDRSGLDAAEPLALRASHVKNLDLVLLRRGNDTADRFYRLLPHASADLRVAFQTEQLMTAFNMCANGLGATVFSDSLVRHLPYTAPMLYVPLKGEAAQRSIRVFYLRGSLAPAVRAFVETVDRVL